MRTIKISDNPHQSFRIEFENKDIECEVRYLTSTQIWTLSIAYDGKTISNHKISCGVFMFKQHNLPFDIGIVNNTKTGIDPYLINDFSAGRYEMILFDRDDMEYLRGYEVE